MFAFLNPLLPKSNQKIAGPMCGIFERVFVFRKCVFSFVSGNGIVSEQSHIDWQVSLVNFGRLFGLESVDMDHLRVGKLSCYKY